ncbi:MAG: SDR family NAD(P)-dependent oxidoreductase [Candidatus Nanopelagicales bacterium]
MNTLSGQRIWVIGASSGIGAAVAQELERQGCRVAVSARREQELHRVSGGRMVVAVLDVLDAASVRRAAAEVEAALGGIDLAVIVAGYWERMAAVGFDRDAFVRHIEANVIGMANCIDAVLPRMLEQGHGTIAGVASVAGYRGMPGAQGYGASKAAQLNLLESLRVGLRGTGVNVQTVSPGFVATPMTAANSFPMPFIISAEQAARHMVRGLTRGRAEIVFPWPMAIIMKSARLVPQQWWPRLMAARSREQRS